MSDRCADFDIVYELDQSGIAHVYHHDGDNANPLASLTIIAILAPENVSTEPSLFDSWKNVGKQLPSVRQVPP